MYTTRPKFYVVKALASTVEKMNTTSLEQLARDTQTPPEELVRLAASSREKICWMVSANTNAPAAALEKLVNKDATIRFNVARHVNSSVETLEYLTNDADVRVLTAVGENKNSTENIFLKLLNTEKVTNVNKAPVIASIVGNPALPPALMWKIAKRESIGTATMLAKNPKVPSEILDFMASEENQQQYYGHRLIVEKNRLKEAIGRNLNTDPETLTKLATDTEERARMSVAKNPNTPKETLTRLANDADVAVAAGVASNRNTPENVIVKLAQHSNPDVLQAIAANPYVPANILDQLADHEDEAVRYFVAQNPNTAISTLQKLDQTNESSVKYAVNVQRIKLLEIFTETLPNHLKTQSELLAPSFTGWPDDLATTLINLNPAKNETIQVDVENKRNKNKFEIINDLF